MLGAMAAAAGLFFYIPSNPFAIGFNIFVGIALLVSGVIALMALGRGGLPKEAGGAAGSRASSETGCRLASGGVGCLLGNHAW